MTSLPFIALAAGVAAADFPAVAPTPPDTTCMAECCGREPPAEEAAGVAVSGAPARAPLETAPTNALAAFGGFSLSGNVTLASQYRYRGTNLSGDRVALQGGLDLDHASGFYIGLWGSQLSNRTTGYGDIELDIYGGYSFPLVEGVTADIGVIAYTFPNAPAGGGRNFVELTSSLTASLGPARAKLGLAWDPDANGFAFAGFVRDNLYLYSDLGIGIPATPVTVKAHLGYTDGTRRLATNSGAFDWSVGASYALSGPFSLSLEYVDAGADLRQGPINPNSGNLVARLSVSF
ncbi:MAG: TorF family putative porin [Erythrobacter sp.]